MNIELDLFKKYKINYDKLLTFGFINKNNKYEYSKKIMNNSFEVIVTIENDNIIGKVYDLEMDAEYTNIRVKDNQGEFVSKVREEYINILLDIRNNCFIKNYFILSQANRITEYIMNKYNSKPEFLWDNDKDGVFRNNNQKWFGIIMNIKASKIKDAQGNIEIINVKSDNIDSLLNKKGIYKGYHMNKNYWITITLDDSLSDMEIEALITESYKLVNSPTEWIVPANPKYYDINEFFKNKDIVEWKQSSDVSIGDIVYIYVGLPYSSIMYKCEAIEVNIPYNYKDNNLSISKVMKLKLVKRYNKDDITFKKLNELGITAIRGPRKITNKISNKF